jgi:transposase
MAAGRPTKLNTKLTAKITQELQLGMFIETVCELNGITRETYYQWLKRGRAAGEKPDAKERLYVDFLQAVTQASAEAEAHALSQIRKGVDNWTSQAWFLERRFRQRWARTVDQSGMADIKPGGGVNFVIQYPTKAEDVVPEPEDEQQN